MGNIKMSSIFDSPINLNMSGKGHVYCRNNEITEDALDYIEDAILAYDKNQERIKELEDLSKEYFNESEDLRCEKEDLQERIKELEAKLAMHETKINCWSCGKSQSLHQHAENDGFCIRCDAEIELGLG